MLTVKEVANRVTFRVIRIRKSYKNIGMFNLLLFLNLYERLHRLIQSCNIEET